MVGIGEASAAVSALSAARKFLKELKQGKLSKEHQGIVEQALEVVNDGQEKLADMQAKIIDLQQDNQSLTEDLKSLNNWNERRDQYSLVKTEVGGIVLKSNDETVPHFACPSCAEMHREIHILQRVSTYTADGRCPRCGNCFEIEQATPMPAIGVQGEWSP